MTHTEEAVEKKNDRGGRKVYKTRDTIAPEKKREIANAMLAYRRERGVSQDDFAKEVTNREKSVSKGYVSLMESNDPVKQEPISDETWIHIANYLGIALTEQSAWNLYTTGNVKRIFGLCERVIDEKVMVAIAADTGYGKTSGLRYFRAKNPNAYYCLLRTTMNAKAIVQCIANAYNLSIDGKLSDMVETLAHTMKRKGGVCILDDSGKVIDKAYPILQELFDLTEGKCAIILAGTKALKKKCDLGKARGQGSWAEFTRRISYWLRLLAPKYEEIKDICENNGVTSDVVMRFIKQKADNFGDVRNYVLAVKRFPPETEWTREMLVDLPIGTSDYEV